MIRWPSISCFDFAIFSRLIDPDNSFSGMESWQLAFSCSPCITLQRDKQYAKLCAIYTFDWNNLSFSCSKLSGKEDRYFDMKGVWVLPNFILT